jgi:hypothetical protein
MTAQMAQYITDGIFETGAGLVRVFYPFGNKLTDFKAVVALRKSAMDLFGTHSKLRSYW